MLERHFAKLRARNALSPDGEQTIRTAINEYREHLADNVLINPGVELTHSTLLLDGILCRYRDLRNGQRQITELHVRGDFADLHSFTLKHLDQSIMSLTPRRVTTVLHDRLTEITQPGHSRYSMSFQKVAAVVIGKASMRPRSAEAENDNSRRTPHSHVR